MPHLYPRRVEEEEEELEISEDSYILFGVYFVLFCFVLFCFVLFCFVLFCFVLFCFVLFCFVHCSYLLLFILTG